MTTSFCQHCEHTINGNVRNCPLCGGTTSQKTTGTVRHCPRCRTSLAVHSIKGCDLDYCEQCEGLWLEPHEFDKLTTEFNVYRDDESDPNYQRPPLARAEGYLPCASCNKLMTRQNFKAVSGVIIDTCINCGVWLDKNELKQIRDFIASGGLDAAQDRKLFTQGQAIGKLEDRVSDLEMMEKMLNKFSVKRILFRGF